MLFPRVENHAGDNRKSGTLGSFERQFGLGHVCHGFDHQPIDAGFGQQTGLLAECSLQFVLAHVAGQ